MLHTALLCMSFGYSLSCLSDLLHLVCIHDHYVSLSDSIGLQVSKPSHLPLSVTYVPFWSPFSPPLELSGCVSANVIDTYIAVANASDVMHSLGEFGVEFSCDS